MVNLPLRFGQFDLPGGSTCVLRRVVAVVARQRAAELKGRGSIADRETSFTYRNNVQTSSGPAVERAISPMAKAA